MKRKFALLAICFILAGCNPFAITERTTVPADVDASGPTPIEALEECPATRPPDPAFAPQMGIAPEQGYFFYGSDALWTTLPISGVWEALPQSEQGFTQKMFWWSEDFDISVEINPSLTVTALLLDDKNTQPLMTASSPATTGQHGTGSFMLVGMDFPSAGCWQVTGAYRNATLVFSILVKK